MYHSIHTLVSNHIPLLFSMPNCFTCQYLTCDYYHVFSHIPANPSNSKLNDIVQDLSCKYYYGIYSTHLKLFTLISWVHYFNLGKWSLYTWYNLTCLRTKINFNPRIHNINWPTTGTISNLHHEIASCFHNSCVCLTNYYTIKLSIERIGMCVSII